MTHVETLQFLCGMMTLGGDLEGQLALLAEMAKKLDLEARLRMITRDNRLTLYMQVRENADGPWVSIDPGRVLAA
jgi:hypothetical protein